MLSELRFVQGAVSKKDFVPAMRHFLIDDHTIRAYNGLITLSSPINLDVTCNPNADKLISAISKCTDTVSLVFTGNKLKIKSGKFRAAIDCLEESFPFNLPEGERFDIDGQQLLTGLKKIYPFIGVDASRQWAMGALMKGSSLFATNNVCLVEYWLGGNISTPINIPRSAVKEIIRIGEAPLQIQIADNSATFHYSDNRWLQTQLYVTDWPDLRALLDRPANLVKLPETMFTGIENISPFVNKLGQVWLLDNLVSSSENKEEGPTYEIPGLSASGIYQISILKLLDGVADTVDFSTYPAPCAFRGDRVRGVIIGMKPL